MIEGMRNNSDLILRRPPPGPAFGRPEDRLRGRLEGWMHGTDSRPSFETHRYAMLLRMRL
jgi:hypothetical protein